MNEFGKLLLSMFGYTNIVPASATFTTVNGKPGEGDGGDASWGQNIADNTGFNYLGTALKPNISFGSKVMDRSSDGATTTIDFGSDKTDGVSDFNGTAYVVFLQFASAPSWAGGGTGNVDYEFYVSSRATGSCVVTYDYASGAGANPLTANPTMLWLAFGI